jgi:hypothetical protein
MEKIGRKVKNFNAYELSGITGEDEGRHEGFLSIHLASALCPGV